MKVIIQDLESMRYLAGNGRWVASRDDARDFYSLLPAYYFARDHTSRHFQVVLYCPEDHFCASIIAGKGVGTETKHAGGDTVAVKIIKSQKSSSGRGRSSSKPLLLSVNGVVMPAGFDAARRHLN